VLDTPSRWIQMHTPSSDTARKGLLDRWTSPPRSGIRLVISPSEFRHLRAWARVRIAGGIVLAGLGLVTLSFGANDSKTYWSATAFPAAAPANLAFAYWELSIARSPAASDAISARGSASQKPRPR
jgi:hypothetical protein